MKKIEKIQQQLNKLKEKKLNIEKEIELLECELKKLLDEEKVKFVDDMIIELGENVKLDEILNAIKSGNLEQIIKKNKSL